jgi:O-6-methylguanine DNA methyltransferase
MKLSKKISDKMKAYPAFYQAVWRACAEIPKGQVRTYGWIARRVGKPKAARAVGQALGKNPFSPAVPCHRVVGADGRLRGFSAAGGVAAKRRMLVKEGALLACLSLIPAIHASAMEVTVYNDNLGLIKEVRSFTLKPGVQDLKVTDVAAQVDPTSVHFKSLTSPEAVSVLEQNFQYDLINQDKLMEKYLGKEIELERILGRDGDRKETLKGVLLSSSGGRILQVDGKILVNPPGSPILPELPEGLLTKPTLLWKLNAKKGGSHDCELSYLTAGMGWRSDYIVVSNAPDDKMDLNAWVTINNGSGATYKDAKLKLIAGDVHRADEVRAMRGGRMKGDVMAMAAEAPQFAEKSFFEYHMYTLQRPATLRERETKQIEMASAADVPLKKLFLYDGARNLGWGAYNEYTRTDPNYGAQGDKKVNVMLEFKNSKDNNLGMPLPKGRVRVYKKDTDGSLTFIGEDSIDHTPKDEKIRIEMGNAFDVVGERKRVDFKVDSKARWFQESFELRLRNHKDSDITVTVVEHLYRWTNWKITDASQKWEKKDAQTVEFSVPVKKDGEAVVAYTVKYSW